MSKTILIVDDSASIRQLVSMALKGEGYEVIEACDGKDALTKLDGRKINLIVSDVNMPNMDGITLVKEVKNMPSYKFTPIIMLTTEGADDKKEQGKAAGAKAWIVKPFQAPQLLQAVKMLASV
jgi:two-component system, chemotaxis family, chemotaxis protein CheY